MEENEYKSTYNELASVRCVFEKAITNNYARCKLARHFYLADREGYSCKNSECSLICSKFLGAVREKSVFVFKLHNLDDPLPHNKEMKVQVGGIRGLLQLVDNTASDPNMQPVVENIHDVISGAIVKSGSLGQLPYSEIIQSVEQFQGRRRRQ